MKETKLSIKKIAEMTGYSVATVSRVINQNGRFSKETEEKIMSVIREHGYIPDVAAKSLRTNSSRIVGIVLPSIRNELFAKTYIHAHEILQNAGYMTALFDTHENTEHPFGDENTYDLFSMFRAMNVCALIVISVREHYHSFEKLGIPVVYIDCSPDEPGRNHMIIEYDLYQGGRLAAQHLYERGCRNIAAVTSMHTAIDAPMLRGASDFLMENGMVLNCSPALYEYSEKMSEFAKMIAKAWRNGMRFDGLIMPKDAEAVTAIFSLAAEGVKVPEEVKVIGCDDVSIAENAFLPLTTIHLDTDKAAELAADNILAVLKNSEKMVETYNIPSSLVIRAST